MAHRGCRYSLFSACVLVCFTLSTAAFAASNPDRTSWGHTLSIGPNEEAGDVTCLGCSIYIRGQVSAMPPPLEATSSSKIKGRLPVTSPQSRATFGSTKK